MKNYTNGGYALIDCKSMNLLGGSTPQTITGLYKQISDAYESGKEIVFTNAVYGTGVPTTPFGVMVIKEDGSFICSFSILQVTVTSADSVTISSLIG